MRRKRKLDAFEIIRKELEQYDLQSVANAAEISKTTLFNWVNKRNKANFTTLVKVANVLGFEVNVEIL